MEIKVIYGGARESADQARLDKVEKCSQEAALSKQRTGHPSSSRTPFNPETHQLGACPVLSRRRLSPLA